MKDLLRTAFLQPLSSWLLLSGAVAAVAFTNSSAFPAKTKEVGRLGGAMLAVGLVLSANLQRNSLTSEATELPELESASVALSTAPLLELATNAKKFPHVMVIGKTGAGKTTLAQYLASLTEGKRYAIAPHLDPSKLDEEWQTCDGVFCGGRNYGSESDPEISYSELVGGTVECPTAFQIMRCLLTEMDYRYKSTEGFDSHEIHNWFLDETPAIARALGKQFGDLLAPQLYEARKVGIRLWVLTQNDQVEAMQIKGSGKMRDNFSYLYCGATAPARLRSLRQRQPKGLAEGTYWCVVDSTPAALPSLEDMHASLSLAVNTNRYIARFPDVTDKPKVPSALEVAKSGVTDAVVEAYARELETLQLARPGIGKTEALKLWGFTGRYHSVGTHLWDFLSE